MTKYSFAVLFARASGTPKTVLPRCCCTNDPLRVELGQVMSKYIGKNEKHLVQVFDAAGLGPTRRLLAEVDPTPRQPEPACPAAGLQGCEPAERGVCVAGGALSWRQRLLLTVEEAAACLCVGRTYMFDLIATGAVPSVRLERLRRVRVDDLERYVSSLRRRPPGWASFPKPNATADVTESHSCRESDGAELVAMQVLRDSQIAITMNV